MKLLLFLVFLLLSLFGLCEFLHLIRLIMIFPKRKMNATLVVVLKEETAIRQMMFAGEQLKWLGSKYADRIIIVAENLSADTVLECEQLASKYNLKFVVKGKG
ncbi:MAG: hypothetical protein J6C27_00585 [Clostridia bacterium]|nr:hypothetical protein [Clostridia bacterium]